MAIKAAKTPAAHRRSNARGRHEEFALIPLLMIVIVCVLGILLIAPSTIRKMGVVLTRTLREQEITSPPRHAAKGMTNSCSADEPEMLRTSEPAKEEAAAPKGATPEERAASPVPAPSAATQSSKVRARRPETLANAKPGAHP